MLFEFRIIEISDGNQIIDQSVKTPYKALTPSQMLEYSEMENQIAVMERMKRKMQREAEHQRKISRILLYKAARAFGLV